MSLAKSRGKRENTSLSVCQFWGICMRNWSMAKGVLLAGFLTSMGAALAFGQGGGKNVAPAKPAGNAAAAGSATKGKKTFEAQCAVCHYTGADAKKIGPGLKGLIKRGKYADGRPIDDASLKDWIEKGGKNMPSFKEVLKPEEIRDVVAYLKTL